MENVLHIMRRVVLRSIIALVSVLVFVGTTRTAKAQSAPPVPIDIAQDTKGGVGPELDKLKKETESKKPRKTKKKPDVTLKEGAKKTSDVKEEAPSGKGYKITRIDIRGDKAVLDATGLRARLRSETVGQTLTPTKIRAIAKKYQDLLVDEGYYLARVWAPSTDYGKGTVVYQVDAGRIGKLRFYKRQDGKKVPYKGRYYSQEQIERRLRSVKTGEVFDYGTFYSAFYGVNAHPDLTMDVDLNVREDGKGDEAKRAVDMDFQVEERIPIHGILEFNNAGTDITDEWGVGLTLQHLNLTKHDDILTLNIPVSLDFQSLRSVAGSYLLPHNIGNGGLFSAFAGYSEINSEQVIPEGDNHFKVEGDGWYVGGQASYDVVANDEHFLSLALGITRSSITDTLFFGGKPVPENDTDTDLTPISASVAYSDVQPDALGGRNSIALVSTIHIGGFLGSSEDEEFDSQRQNADADYFVQRVNYGRVQPILGMDKEEGQQWIAFLTLSGQITSEPLIPAEQIGLGGASTVRGYKEREFLGDKGATGSLELRTPVLKSAYLDFLSDAESSDFEQYQFVVFADGGHAALEDTLEGEDSSQSLYSVGAGLRMSLGTHFQTRFDWGFPLKTTEESDSSGRAHLSAQLQF